MRLGIDFGTTRTLVAMADRGNYPVLGVVDAQGDPHEHVPSVVGLAGDGSGRLVGGWDALAQWDAPAGRDALPGSDGVNASAALARSFKRLLARPDASAATPVAIDAEHRPLGEVLAAFAAHVIAGVRRHPLVRERIAAGDAVLEAVVGVPANAGSAQRLLTLDAFTRAGVRVLALVNEPSAAAFEYSHRHARTLNSRRSDVVVYDLGGGTFDASLVRIDGAEHAVLATSGDPHLGGDDFDERLVELALSGADGLGNVGGHGAVIPAELERLRETARAAKERLTPQTRRVLLERGDDDLIVLVDDYYRAVAPLVERTLEAMGPCLARSIPAGRRSAKPTDFTDSEIAGIYLVGGASALPLVPRLLRERFGRRVHRSPYPAAATAIGLAIAADPGSDYWLLDRSSRGVGVFRERAAGAEVDFDVLLDAGDGAAGATAVREYRAAHNVGWFRFVEFTREGAGRIGNLTVLAEVVVPFERGLVGVSDLERVAVERRDPGPLVRETVRLDANGIANIRLEVPDLGVTIDRAVGARDLPRQR
jgi:molecular chaperone DnaK (HSP70)